MKYWFVIITLILSFAAIGELTVQDESNIESQLREIEQAVNKGDVTNIISHLAPNARAGLESEIRTELQGQSITYRQSIKSKVELNNNQVKVKGRFSAEGVGWSTSGFSNYYILENVDGTWKIVDTDFHEMKPNVSWIIGIIFGVLALLFLPMGVFWIWMLVDVIKRDFDDKMLWVVVIILLGFIGSLVYYFVIKRNLNRNN